MDALLDTDRLTLALATSRAEHARDRAKLLRYELRDAIAEAKRLDEELAAVQAAMRERYALGEDDRADLATGEIKRAAKSAPAKEHG